MAFHVFVPDIDLLDVDPDDDHHLRRVLRLRPGEAGTVSDGRGAWRACTWTGSPGVALAPEGEVEREPRPTPQVTVGFALTKGDRPEWVTQKLTEVGVDVIVPFSAERSVVRWDAEKAARQHERLGRVAREAAMQSRRSWLPTVLPMGTFAGIVEALGPGVALAQPGGSPPSLGRPGLLVGPEGGFSPAELEAAPGTVGLGPTVLRAETAAVAAGLSLCWLRAGIVQSVAN
jgi:16S rRNA (uracil1498-N3)-methyltransferase